MIGIDFETVGLTPQRGTLRLIQTANGKGSSVRCGVKITVPKTLVFEIEVTKPPKPSPRPPFCCLKTLLIIIVSKLALLDGN